MALFIPVLVAVFGGWLVHSIFGLRSEKLVDKYVVGFFVCLLPISFIVWAVLVMHEPLSIEDWSRVVLFFLIIVICPVATYILLRYRLLSSGRNNTKKMTWTILGVLVSILVAYFGSLGAFTPTAFAVKQHPAFAKILINAGIGINARSSWWTTPLGIAVDQNDIDTAKLLMSKGSEVNVAYRYSGGKPVKLLRANDAAELRIVEEQLPDDTLLMVASRKGYTEMMKLLIDSGADVNAKTIKGKTALMDAAFIGKADTVKLLLVMGADINAKDEEQNTALIYAAKRGTVDTIQALLDKGCSFTQEEKNNALVESVHWFLGNLNDERLNSMSRINFFLSAGADVEAQDRTGSTALMYAAEKNRLDLMQLFIDKGADVNAKDRAGKTALMRSAGLQPARILLERGADVNGRDNDGRTALMWAVTRTLANEADIVVLLDAGAEINTQDNQGRTPLMWAATSGSRNPINILLDRGARINVQDKSGKTPLIYCAGGVPPDIVLRLLEMGADPKVRDKSGRSALDYAVDYDRRSNWPDHKKTAIYLKQFGGE